VGEFDAGIDYGLYALRNESVVRAYGVLTALLHERMREAAASHPVPAKLRELLEIPIDREHYPVLRVAHPLRETLQLDLDVASWLFERAGAGLPRGVLRSIDELRQLELAPWADNQRKLIERLHVPAELALLMIEFFALDRAVLRALELEQGKLNDCLRRSHGRPLSSDDVAAYSRRYTPVLHQVLAEGLGISITTSANSVTLISGGRELVLN
jgi:hypothetical protein